MMGWIVSLKDICCSPNTQGIMLWPDFEVESL